MPEPFDYTLRGVQDPGQSFMEGVTGGNALYELRQKRLAEQKAALAQEKMQADFAAVYQKPTPEGVSGLMLRYPQFGEKFKPALEAMTEQQRTSRRREAMDIVTPFMFGKPEIGLANLRQQIEAAKNSGDTATAKSKEGLLKNFESTETGEFGNNSNLVGLMSYLSADLGPKGFEETFKPVFEQRLIGQKASVELREAEAKASKAAVDAKFAEAKAVQDLQRGGWDITKIQNDIKVSKQNIKIATMNAALSRESDTIQREKLALDVQAAKDKRDEMVRTKTYDAETALSTVTQSQELIKGIVADEDTLRAAIGTSAWRGAIPGTKTRAMKDKIEQLQNIIASANLDKLKGPMSDKDIVFLKNIGTNLDRYQNEEEFIKELKRVFDSMDKAESRIRSKYGMPERSVTVGY